MIELSGNDVRSLDWFLRFWPVPCVSVIGSALGTMVFRRAALRWDVVDRPDALVKTHREPVAYLGGLGMLTGFVAGLLVGIRCLDETQVFAESSTWLVGILVGGTLAAAVGLLDDLRDLSPRTKILGQMLAALALMGAGIGPDFAQMLAPAGWQLSGWVAQPLNYLLVFVLVLGASNSLNLMDGLDGLCAGVSGIIAFGMLILSLQVSSWIGHGSGDSVRIVTCLTLIGAILGFLPFNRHPARIFMGDAGSLFLGLVHAALILLFARLPGPWFLAAIILFGLPALDTAVALVRRWVNHRPLFRSDRGHLYDQMMDRGMSLRRAVDCCYLLASLYVLLGWAISQLPPRNALLSFLVIVLCSSLFVIKKGYLRMKGHRGVVRRSDAQSSV